MSQLAEIAHFVVYVTCPTLQEAESLARIVVSEKLAACANLVPRVKSFYWWEGSVQEDHEVLLVIKTRQQKLSALEARVKQLHSYTVPEFIAMPISHGSPEYLHWITENTP
jgi:periplasmic divalent cation tolerance protein